MRIGDLLVDPPVALAPMSGITDLSFRRLCREAGAGLASTGLISANALRYRSEKTRGLLHFPADDHPISAQVFGPDPEVVAAAAAIAVDRGADMVDINMGCAVPKVLKARAGAALMADPERAEAMVRAVVAAVGEVPVGVKLRRGWRDRGEDAATLARRCEGAGAAVVAVHPRWASEGFRGWADWRVIAALKQAVAIPVIGNGDIHDAADAVRMQQETGCDGVMIGRAALGDPWIFTRVAAVLRGEQPPADSSPEERMALVARHLSLVVAEGGEMLGVRRMRKHLGWYLKGLPNAAALRNRVNQAKRQAELLEVLEEARPAAKAGGAAGLRSAGVKR
jgi:tRNA-dihydrouridine synthase B